MAIGKFIKQTRKACFYRIKEGVRRGDFDWKSIGKEQKFVVVTTSHCLSCGGSR